MTISQRIAAAWRALMPTGGKRADPYAGIYGTGSTAGFAGGSIGRLTASLATWSGSGKADNDVALPSMRARARALAAESLRDAQRLPAHTRDGESEWIAMLRKADRVS